MNKNYLKYKLNKYIKTITMHITNVCCGSKIKDFNKKILELEEELRVTEGELRTKENQRVEQLIKTDLAEQRAGCLEKSIVNHTDSLNKIEDKYINKIEKLVEKINQLKEERTND
jgi:hypothetical protein